MHQSVREQDRTKRANLLGLNALSLSPWMLLHLLKSDEGHSESMIFDGVV